MCAAADVGGSGFGGVCRVAYDGRRRRSKAGRLSETEGSAGTNLQDAQGGRVAGETSQDLLLTASDQ